MARRAIPLLIVAYLVFEAALLWAFWLWLAMQPSASRLFVRGEAHADALRIFLAGDVLVFAGCAVAAAVAIVRRGKHVPLWLSAHAGIAAYSGACAVAGWIVGWFTWRCPVSMLAAMIASMSICVMWSSRGRRP